MRRNISAALCHHYDVIQSRDVIGHVTIRLSLVDLLYVFGRNQTRTCVSLSFRVFSVKSYDVMMSSLAPKRLDQLSVWTV